MDRSYMIKSLDPLKWGGSETYQGSVLLGASSGSDLHLQEIKKEMKYSNWNLKVSKNNSTFIPQTNLLKFKKMK